MRGLFLFFVAIFFALGGIITPFAAALGYLWVDLIVPQKLAFSFLTGMRFSLIMACWMFLIYFFHDKKTAPKNYSVLVFFVIFAFWITITTINAVHQEPAWSKWDWAFKGLVFAIFFPFVFRTRIQIEAAMIVIVACIGFYTLTTGTKTLFSGGQYGGYVSYDTRLTESSTLALIAIAFIPINYFLANHSVIICNRFVSRVIFHGLSALGVLTMFGTYARTGLVTLAALIFFVVISKFKRMILIIPIIILALYMGLSYLPESWITRMSTIDTSTSESSALGRLAVWAWTLEYVGENWFGGGFQAYLSNKGIYQGFYIQAKAFHNIFFEVLGEHGIPGLAIYVCIIFSAVRNLRISKGISKLAPSEEWIGAASNSVMICLFLYLIGGSFVGIAFQPLFYYLAALSVCLRSYAQSRYPQALAQSRGSLHAI